MSSIESSTERMFEISDGSTGRGMEDIFLFAADSEREKTKERISEQVGEERKSSWSRGDKMRREGSVNASADASGGVDNVGVSGIGRGFCGGDDFLRGTRRGRLLSRSGLSGDLSSACEGVLEGGTAEGISASMSKCGAVLDKKSTVE